MALTSAQRQRLYRARKALKSGQHIAFQTPVHCPWCGGVEKRRSDALFCSDACAKSANRVVRRSDYEHTELDAKHAVAFQSEAETLFKTHAEILGWDVDDWGEPITLERWISGELDEWIHHCFYADGGSAATPIAARITRLLMRASYHRHLAGGFSSYLDAIYRASVGYHSGDEAHAASVRYTQRIRNGKGPRPENEAGGPAPETTMRTHTVTGLCSA